MAAETDIAPPGFPLIAKINQAITDYYFDHFVEKYLAPLGLSVRVTGKLRDVDRNAEVGGAENSAHLHGLAIDFQLLRAGKPLTPADTAQVFRDVIKPNFPGYAVDETPIGKNHIHVNYTRLITTYTSLAGFAVAGILSVPIFKKLFAPSKKKG